MAGERRAVPSCSHLYNLGSGLKALLPPGHMGISLEFRQGKTIESDHERLWHDR